jgi:enterochelin esterase-like enzyme
VVVIDGCYDSFLNQYETILRFLDWTANLRLCYIPGRHIILAMIPKKRFTLLFVCLTFGILAACEPLAPEQTPQYIVVTGETPLSITVVSPTPPLGDTIPPVSSSGTPVAAAVVNAGGVVNTPLPSETPVPAATVVPSATPFVCTERTGQTLRSSFPSTIMGGDVPFRIYLPPCFYDTLKRYPYVVLLHGTGYDEAMWEDLGAPAVMDQGITKGTLPPMVLVMPDGDALAELNDQPDGASYETLVLDELIPSIERDFCLWGSREGRAIGGISRGGFWAFSIAFRHPEVFAAVGGHSPHFEPDNAPPEVNPLDLASRVNLTKFSLRIYMDNAASDYVSANVIQMSDILRERSIAHEYLINPTGDHDMEYWSSHVAEYLSFYGQPWPYDTSALPSCLEPSP